MSARLREELWRTPDFLGFSAHWVWIWCVFWSGLFYGSEHFTDSPFISSLPLEPLWIISLTANVITIAVLLIISTTKNPLSYLKALPVLAAAITMGGTLLIAPLPFPFAGEVISNLFVVGAVMTGIGSGMVVVLWGELFASLGSRRTITYSVVSLLIAAVIYLVLMALPAIVSPLVVAVMPVISMGCFVHFKSSLARPLRSERNVRIQNRPPLSLIAISLLFGVSFGVMKGLLAPLDAAYIEMRDLFNIVAITCASVAIYVTTSICKMDFDRLTYQIALPLMAAGFLFVPISGQWAAFGTAIHQFGYQYFYIILWALWPILATRGKVPSGWVACWGLLSIQFGQLAGSLCSVLYIENFSSEFALAMAAAFCIFLILLGALILSGNKPASTGWGFVKPIEEASATSPFEQSCTYLARQNHLSPREIEVFFLLAKGRNRAHIGEELVISDETVKTHTKNIYRKMQVHSQQELIDTVEQESP